MSEWLKERDWKSRVRPQRCTGGSNPPLSAMDVPDLFDSRVPYNGGL